MIIGLSFSLRYIPNFSSLNTYDSNISIGDSLKGYTATIYQMRYDNVKLLHGNILMDSLLSIFQYEDSMNEKSEMFIFPKSKYITYSMEDYVEVTQFMDFDSVIIPYHNPIIQLKLHSKNPNTLVLTDATLEIENYRYDDHPAYRFNWNGSSFNITNESFNLITSGKMKYSFLHEGETFTQYKRELSIELAEKVTKINLSNISNACSLTGEVVLSNGNSYKFHWENDKNFPDYTYSSLRKENKLDIPVYFVSNKFKQEIKLKEFYRSLTKGEVDDEVHFFLESDNSCTFKVRLRMTTSFGKTLYSNYIYIRYSKPNNVTFRRMQEQTTTNANHSI